jgi:hypothetical protein
MQANMNFSTTTKAFEKAANTFKALGLQDTGVMEALEESAGRATRNVRDKILMLRCQSDDMPETEVICLSAYKEKDYYKAVLALRYDKVEVPLTVVKYYQGD